MADSADFDWDLCLFCQKHLRFGQLACPLNTKRDSDGYLSLGKDIKNAIELCFTVDNLNSE